VFEVIKMNTIKIRATLDRALLAVCSFALTLLVVTVTWQVFSRYILNDPSSFTDELSRYTMIWLGLFGASYLFGVKGHLAITLISHRLPDNLNIVLQLLINALSFAFLSLAMFKGGIDLMSRTTQQLSPALQIPMSYIYSILPISAVIIFIYLILNTLDLVAKNKTA
jgi:TRAP-type C4-dicarboxylate transport system permease small subunit